MIKQNLQGDKRHIKETRSTGRYQIAYKVVELKEFLVSRIIYINFDMH